MWNDFDVLYLVQLQHLSQGYLLYRDVDYNAPPLFLYSMLPFYEIGGSKAAMIPIVLADALTAPVIYVIVRKVASEKVAMLAGLAYAFSPIALVDEGYLWLTSQPMTLFILLSVLLLKKDRPVLGAVALAIAGLFNQEALFILPVFVAYMIKSKFSLLRPAGLFALTFVGALLPFVVLAPNATLGHLLFFPVNLGPPEVSRLPTYIPPVAPSAEQSCSYTAIPHVYSGAVCGEIANFKAFAWFIEVSKIDSVADFVAPFLFLLFAAGLFVVRRSANILELASAYSIIGGLFAFSVVLLHTTFGNYFSLAYYFVPVYALILASVTSGRSLVVGCAAMTLGYLAGEGPFQFIIPTACIFAFTLMQDASLRASAKSAEHATTS